MRSVAAACASVRVIKEVHTLNAKSLRRRQRLLNTGVVIILFSPNGTQSSQTEWSAQVALGRQNEDAYH